MTATIITPPERTLEQRLDALRKANRIRTSNATLKRDLKDGRKSVSDALDSETAASMKVFDLVMAVPQVGRIKANETLRRARISPAKTLGGLTARQRRELLSTLAAYRAVRARLHPADREAIR
jgi:hypothetical protein